MAAATQGLSTRPRALPSPALVAELVRRDLRLRYRRSVLGVLWSQLTPLATVAVLTLVFTRVVPLDIEDYPAFVLVGLLPWLWFSAALVAGTESVVSAPDLLRQPRFPRTALPVVAVASTLANHLLALPVAIVAATAASGGPHVSVLAVPLLLAVQFVLVCGPVFVLGALHVRLRDTAHIVGLALLPLFYATPVFYDAAALDGVRAVRVLNPMVPVVDGYRTVLLDGQWPPMLPLLGVAAVGVVLTIGGWAFYRGRMARFLEEL